MNSELNSRDPAKQAGGLHGFVFDPREEIAGKRYPAIPFIETLCDPTMKTVKA